MNPDVAVAFRILLTLAGGAFVTRGYMTEAALEAAVGAIITLGAVAWAWWSNRPASGEAKQIAEKVAADPVAAPDIVKLNDGETVSQIKLGGQRSTDEPTL